MPIPEHVRRLRAAVGQELLLLPGVCAVVFDEQDRVLLVRGGETGRWSPVGGILEPGEQPADAVVREVYEETAVRCVPERLVVAETLRPVTYRNGDRCQFLDLTFRCRAVGGEARVNDDESLEVAWFPLDKLPDMEDAFRFRVARAREDGAAWFRAAAGPGAPTDRPAVDSVDPAVR